MEQLPNWLAAAVLAAGVTTVYAESYEGVVVDNGLEAANDPTVEDDSPGTLH